jgi:very-short-patch-repair endonuclease
MPSSLEWTFAAMMLDSGLRDWVEEYQFDRDRKFRFDFAWPGLRVAVEVEGGNFVFGRHTRGKGFETDCEKYNLATLQGWSVFRFTEKHVNDGSGVDLVKKALLQRQLMEYVGR